jgi:hypothetical protein
MNYVLYTPNAVYWNAVKGEYDPPVAEIVYYKNADKTVVLDEIYAPSDCLQGLCFWLGRDAEDTNE